MSKHTPGPWFAPTPTYRTFYVEARIGNRMLQEVASCGPTADPAQQAANARLIAAAPELLEALTLLVAGIENSVSKTYIPLVRANAAIAKATGSEA